jgi:adenylate cyclase
MNPKLIISDPIKGRTFEYDLPRGQTRIGRAADRNDIVLDESQVSREHAILKRAGNNVMLIDLNSANGTFVNGKRINERALTSGDSITISKYILEFQEAPAALSVKYDDQKVGGTIFLRKPEEVGSELRSAPLFWTASNMPSPDDIVALTKKAETLSRIYELNQMLSSVFSLEDIFKKVSEMLFRLTPADRFVVLLQDDQSHQFLPFATDVRRGITPGEEIRISRTVVDHVVQGRVSMLSFDAMTDHNLALARSIILQNIHSVMCAPLLGKDGVLGVIYVDCQQMRTFSEDDLDLLNALAAETSIAVDNATTHRRLVREELARAKYRRFMPPHVVDEILANPDALNLGGKNTLVTALFSDVRGFTSLSERLMPETVVQILNEYFADMTPIVFAHGGLLDKFMGDGLMALFGVPYQGLTMAADAVSAAIDMQRTMISVNLGLKEKGLPEIAIGIGINTGTATVGYIGSQERTDYTAIGDTINLAARLEKHAQPWQILISRSTRELIGEDFPVRPFDQIKMKGKADPVDVYEVIWREVAIHADRPHRAMKIEAE